MIITSKAPSFLNVTEKYYKRILEGDMDTEDSVGAPGVNIIPPVQPIPTPDKEDDEDDASNPELDNIIKSFFRDTESIDDDQIHGLADTLGIDHHEFEEHIYKMLQDYIRNDSDSSSEIPEVEEDELEEE
jgi:hypothetical protein